MNYTILGPGQCGDCAEAPNGVAVCTEFRTDNTGPPASTDEIIKSLDAVRAEYDLQRNFPFMQDF